MKLKFIFLVGLNVLDWPYWKLTGTLKTLLAASSSCSRCSESNVSCTVWPLQLWCRMGLFRWTLKMVSLLMPPGKDQWGGTSCRPVSTSFTCFVKHQNRCALILTILFKLKTVVIHLLPQQVDWPPQKTLKPEQKIRKSNLVVWD